jgi:hypothetical protein
LAGAATGETIHNPLLGRAGGEDQAGGVNRQSLNLPARTGTIVYRPTAAEFAQLRLLEGRKAVAAALKPSYTAATAEQAEQELMEFEAGVGRPLSDDWAELAQQLGACDPLLLVPGRYPACDLYDQCDRIAQLQLRKNYQEPEPISERRGGLQESP